MCSAHVRSATRESVDEAFIRVLDFAEFIGVAAVIGMRLQGELPERFPDLRERCPGREP